MLQPVDQQSVYLFVATAVRRWWPRSSGAPLGDFPAISAAELQEISVLRSVKKSNETSVDGIMELVLRGEEEQDCCVGWGILACVVSNFNALVLAHARVRLGGTGTRYRSAQESLWFEAKANQCSGFWNNLDRELKLFPSTENSSFCTAFLDAYKSQLTGSAWLTKDAGFGCGNIDLGKFEAAFEQLGCR